jgi:hypothetical protein
MGFWQFDYEVDADCVPWCIWCLRGVELAHRSLTLYFSPVAQVAVLHVDADVARHLGPPVVAGNELEGLEAACMSRDARIVVLFNDTMPQVSVFGDIDLTAKHE